MDSITVFQKIKIRTGYCLTRLIAECHDQAMTDQNYPGCIFVEKEWQNPYGDMKARERIVEMCRDTTV